MPGFRDVMGLLMKRGDHPSDPHKRFNTSQGWMLDNPKPTPEDIRRRFPGTPVDWARLASPPSEGVRATWVGHATCLVQMQVPTRKGGGKRSGGVLHSPRVKP